MSLEKVLKEIGCKEVDKEYTHGTDKPESDDSKTNFFEERLMHDAVSGGNEEEKRLSV